MSFRRFLAVFLTLALLAAALPMPAPAKAAETPCHETAQSGVSKPVLPAAHGSCDRCTMGCCLAQLPAVPVLAAVAHDAPPGIAQEDPQDGFSLPPPIAPPRG